MDSDELLDAIASATFDDPESGLALAHQNPLPDSARYWGIVGNGLRQLNRLADAEAAFDRALALPADPFTLSEIHRKSANLYVARERWNTAAHAANHAVTLHTDHGPTGYPGPPDRGLPMALITRGYVVYTANLYLQPADLYQAHADYHHALALTPDPREAPLSHVCAVHNLALLAIETETGLPFAHAAVDHAYRQLAKLGVPRNAPAALRVRWAQTVLRWIVLGNSDEKGTLFFDGIEKALLSVHRRLKKTGAYHDALLVAMDLTLFYLEARPEPDWTAVNDLSLDVYQLDWEPQPEIASAMLQWRQAAHEEKFPPAALDFVYGRVRGLRKPDPRLHAHGTLWGGPVQPSADSVTFHLWSSQTGRRRAPGALS